MTQEEKAKAYDKAVEKAKKELNTYGSQDCDAARQIFGFFPELKESEDERIRKALIQHIIQHIKDKVYEELIAWLEKQGKQKLTDEEMKIALQTEYEKGRADAIAEFEQGEQNTIVNKTPSKEMILAVWELGNNWEELTGGSSCTEYGTQLQYIQNHWSESLYYEKLNQKHTNKITPKFKVGDWITNGACIIKITSADDRYYWHDNDCVGGDIESIDKEYRLWTIQDAKDGDVLKEDSCMFIIEKMKSEGTATVYCCLFDNGDFDLTGSTLSFDVNSTHPATKEQHDLLFQKMKEAGYEWYAEKKELKKIEQKPAYKFKIGDTIHKIKENTVFPMTVEKIEDGFYVCNNNHLFVNTKFQNDYELVEQFISSWSEEDKDISVAIKDHLREYYVEKKGYPYVADKNSQEMKEFQWLNSIKDRVQSQPKQEWSKEDEDALDIAIRIIQNGGDNLSGILDSNKALNWLKSLKPQPKQEWSIENASEGDFLSCKFTSGDYTYEKIVIFKSLNKSGVEGYGINLKNGKLWSSNNEILPYYSKTWTRTLTPATKEQVENFMKNICEHNSQVKTHWKPSEF